MRRLVKIVMVALSLATALLLTAPSYASDPVSRVGGVHPHCTGSSPILDCAEIEIVYYGNSGSVEKINIYGTSGCTAPNAARTTTVPLSIDDLYMEDLEKMLYKDVAVQKWVVPKGCSYKTKGMWSPIIGKDHYFYIEINNLQGNKNYKQSTQDGRIQDFSN